MELILTILIISIISNVFVNQIDPLEWFKKKIGLSQTRKLISGYRFLDLIFYTMWKLLNCVGCVSYWITIGYFYFCEASLDGIIYGFISYALSTWLYNNVFNKISF